MAALPELILNRAFMLDFADAETPCFALGLVESDGLKTGFLAMRPDKSIPREKLAGGIAFGHRLLEIRGETLCQFVFNIYGFTQYSVLVNPAHPMVCPVLEIMLERRDYFFFILNPDGRASAFRSDLGEENLAGLRDNLPAMQRATTSKDAYEAGVKAFRGAPCQSQSKKGPNRGVKMGH